MPINCCVHIKLAKVCEPQQYNTAFNSKQLFLKEGDLHIITPEHNKIALSLAFKRLVSAGINI